VLAATTASRDEVVESSRRLGANGRRTRTGLDNFSRAPGGVDSNGHASIAADPGTAQESTLELARGDVRGQHGGDISASRPITISTLGTVIFVVVDGVRHRMNSTIRPTPMPIT
jgi:hypothetical protein